MRVNDLKSRKQEIFSHGFGPELMRLVTVCRKCGSMELMAMGICSACGEVLPKESLYEDYKSRHDCCRECGTVLAERMAYCPHCGKMILKEAK